MTQGWECPKCGRVWAPNIVKCLPCCREAERGETVAKCGACGEPKCGQPPTLTACDHRPWA